MAEFWLKNLNDNGFQDWDIGEGQNSQRLEGSMGVKFQSELIPARGVVDKGLEE
jgi:hypothetical protein